MENTSHWKENNSWKILKLKEFKKKYIDDKSCLVFYKEKKVPNWIIKKI